MVLITPVVWGRPTHAAVPAEYKDTPLGGRWVPNETGSVLRGNFCSHPSRVPRDGVSDLPGDSDINLKMVFGLDSVNPICMFESVLPAGKVRRLREEVVCPGSSSFQVIGDEQRSLFLLHKLCIRCR